MYKKYKIQALKFIANARKCPNLTFKLHQETPRKTVTASLFVSHGFFSPSSPPSSRRRQTLRGLELNMSNVISKCIFKGIYDMLSHKKNVCYKLNLETSAQL